MHLRSVYLSTYKHTTKPGTANSAAGRHITPQVRVTARMCVYVRLCVCTYARVYVWQIAAFNCFHLFNYFLIAEAEYNLSTEMLCKILSRSIIIALHLLWTYVNDAVEQRMKKWKKFLYKKAHKIHTLRVHFSRGSDLLGIST